MLQQRALRPFLILIALHLIVTFTAGSSVLCQEKERKFRYEYGLSALGGGGDEDGLDVRYYAAYPRWGWLLHERWEIELEGNIGHYSLDSIDMTSLGLNALFSYQLLQFNNGSTFITAGGGFLYLDLDQRPQLTDSSIIGLAQAGFGVKLPVGSKTLLRLEYRFQHVSDPFDSSDGGWNYHCVVLGVSLMKH